jgi:hypothetical protein
LEAVEGLRHAILALKNRSNEEWPIECQAHHPPAANRADRDRAVDKVAA